MNRSIDKGITMLLSQSGLARTWWEDAAMHWLYGKSRIPSSGVKVLTPLELFCKRKPDVLQLRPFGCLAYMHLQKDQRLALTPHTAQCMLVSYPWDYKGWSFYNPHTRKTIISDSTVFHKSVFPFRKTGLGGTGPLVSSVLPSDDLWRTLAAPDALATPGFAPLPVVGSSLIGVATPPPPPLSLVVTPSLAVPDVLPSVPGLLPAAPPLQHLNPPLMQDPKCPRTPPAVKRLTAAFEHHLLHDTLLPEKRALRGRTLGALAEANSIVTDGSFAIPVVDAIECAFNTSGSMEPRTLVVIKGACR